MDPQTSYIGRYDKLVKLMEMKIEKMEPGFARVTMPISEHIKNGMGMAHGGAIFSLADVAFGVAANLDCKTGVVNMCSSIEYLRPGQHGPLVAEAAATRIGGHIASYDVRVYDGENRLIAKAMVTGYITDVPRPE